MLETINSRRSVRKWNGQPFSDSDIHDLLEAGMNAPSAVNEQAWQFVVLTGDPLVQLLRINANTPSSATAAIMICEDRRAEKAKGYAVQDCSAATQNILLAAHTKGLGAVWTAVFPQNIDSIRELLGLPDWVVPFALVPVGHPATTPSKPKSRFDAAKIHFNRW